MWLSSHSRADNDQRYQFLTALLMQLLISVSVLNKGASVNTFFSKRKYPVEDYRADGPLESFLTCSRAPALTVTSVLHLKIQIFHKTAF